MWRATPLVHDLLRWKKWEQLLLGDRPNRAAFLHLSLSSALCSRFCADHSFVAARSGGLSGLIDVARGGPAGFLMLTRAREEVKRISRAAPKRKGGKAQMDTHLGGEIFSSEDQLRKRFSFNSDSQWKASFQKSERVFVWSTLLLAERVKASFAFDSFEASQISRCKIGQIFLRSCVLRKQICLCGSLRQMRNAPHKKDGGAGVSSQSG